MKPLVTFDLFSALLDSRTGGAAAFARLASTHHWPVAGEQVYDAWDPRNKAAQGDAVGWVPWRDTAAQALAATYDELGVAGDVPEGVEALVASLPDWPLWPDVADGLPAVAEHARIGLLSNVDDELFARTAAAALVDHEVALTSERLGASKPRPEIYRRAAERFGPLTHVATSARDVRGALESGIPVVHLRRPGHTLDPDGPVPSAAVSSVLDLPAALPLGAATTFRRE